MDFCGAKDIIFPFWSATIDLNNPNEFVHHDNFNRCDFKVYSETTADGYEVYIATHDDKNITIQDDVYYYDSDLTDVIMEQLEDHYSVYIDEYLYEDIYMDDTFEEYFNWDM